MAEAAPGRDQIVESVRVLFLDVDGVVCCNDLGLLEPQKMMLLAKVCQETGAKVCLSTNWRLHDDLRNRLYTELAAYGCECVGSTPNANEAALQVGMRPLEIRAWVE